MKKNSYSYDELINCGEGKLFGPGTPVNTTIEYIINWVNENRI